MLASNAQNESNAARMLMNLANCTQALTFMRGALVSTLLFVLRSLRISAACANSFPRATCSFFHSHHLLPEFVRIRVIRVKNPRSSVFIRVHPWLNPLWLPLCCSVSFGVALADDWP